MKCKNCKIDLTLNEIDFCDTCWNKRIGLASYWLQREDDLESSENYENYLLQEKVDQEVREYNSLPEGSEED